MVCKTQDCLASGLCLSSGTLKDTTFRKLHLFTSLDEVVGDTYFGGCIRKSCD
jgi:hypothetical protein